MNLDDFTIYEGMHQFHRIEHVAMIQPVWEASDPRRHRPQDERLEGQDVRRGRMGQIAITNVGAMECEDWQLEVNIRPSWGSLTKWSGVTLLEDNKVAGWYSSAQTRSSRTPASRCKRDKSERRCASPPRSRPVPALAVHAARDR
jgi:hypothetical protein